MKSFPKPVEMGSTLCRPFFQVIGGYAALLACLYLLVGLDPTIPVGNFVVDSIEALLPFAGRLIIVWALYCIFYLLLGSLDRDLWLVALFARRLAGFWRRRAFRPWLQLIDSVRVTSFSSWFHLIGHCLPPWLATGWRSGDSVQLE